MKRLARLLLATTVIGIAALVSARPARADINVVFTGAVAEAGQFRWNYDVSVAAGQTVDPFDFFTIYDFNNLVLGTNQQPANWQFSAPFLGPYPPGSTTASTGDSPAKRNLSWQYVGTTPIAGAAFLGTFSARSTQSAPIPGVFAGQTNSGEHGNQGVTQVPAPEPGTMALFGVGALGLIGFVRRRRKAATKTEEPVA
jgi:PEP-CTERM motif